MSQQKSPHPISSLFSSKLPDDLGCSIGGKFEKQQSFILSCRPLFLGWGIRVFQDGFNEKGFIGCILPDKNELYIFKGNKGVSITENGESVGEEGFFYPKAGVWYKAAISSGNDCLFKINYEDIGKSRDRM